MRTAGFILTDAGLTWLWAPVTAKRALLRRQFRRAISYVSWDGSGPTARATLSDLLEDSGNSGIPPGGTSRQVPHR